MARKTHKSKAVRRRRFGWWQLLFTPIFVALIVLFTLIIKDDIDRARIPAPEPQDIAFEDGPEEPEITPIDLQPIVDKWVSSVSGNRSVLIYDLDLDEVVASYNTKEYYNTASLYKLFVVYEGYRRVQNGTWDGNARAGSTGRTINKCLDLAIRESNSPCAETLWAMIGHDTLDTIIERDFEITESSISRLSSHAEDITKIMKIFYEHEDITDENLITVMKDSFLNQPVTTYDWRRGLPSGFSSNVNVYNKVGWDRNLSTNRWNIYHDTAIVEFPDKNRHFIVTVMTNYVDNKDIAHLATMLEQEINKY